MWFDKLGEKAAIVFTSGGGEGTRGREAEVGKGDQVRSLVVGKSGSSE